MFTEPIIEIVWSTSPIVTTYLSVKFYPHNIPFKITFDNSQNLIVSKIEAWEVMTL